MSHFNRPVSGPVDDLTDSALQDPSLLFLNRVLARLHGDPQFQHQLACRSAAGDAEGVCRLLDAEVQECFELDDAWLEDLAGGRGGLPLALMLLAGALGSGHALPGLDPLALSGLGELTAPTGRGARQGPAAAWQQHAIALIQEFEGLALEAYVDPVGIPTIGYGTIRYPDGQAVQLGDRISAERAEQLLLDAVHRHYAPAVFEAIPSARRYSPQQQAALISFTYNVGVGALQRSSLRRRLLAGEDPEQVIAEELPRWSRGDGRELAGLVRRRAAEVALFRSQAG